MQTLIIVSLVYIVGFYLSYSMLRIEHEAEHEKFTKGDSAIGLFVSLLSFVAVVLILVQAWVKNISKTGYWSKPQSDK